MYFKTTTIGKHLVQIMSFCLVFLVLCGFGWGELIDRIVAVVNNEVITLTDINIIQKFGLFEDLEDEPEEGIQRSILDRLISQKLIIQLTSEGFVVDEEELEAYLSDIIQKTDPDLAEEALLQFGLDWDDLKSYLGEKLLFEKIIAQRFSRGAIVSIEEIEQYYEQVYVPSQRQRDRSPQPMIEVLDQIETALKQEKVQGQIQDWIKNLKREANIEIKIS
jgi:peptidyl-prolyl cis-trans isomerase SurA